MPGSLICLTGVDGSGKSTHTSLLKSFLEQRGYSCVVVWGGFKPFISLYFFGFTKLFGYWTRTKKEAYTDPLENAPVKVADKLGKVMRAVFFLDYHLKISLKIKIPLLRNKVVLCDRYFYDLLMELQLSNNLSDSFFRFLPKSLPRPSVTFLMTAPKDITASRRNFDQTFFSKRNKVLTEYAKHFNLFVIDSSKNLEENQDFVRRETLRRLEVAELK